MTWPWTSSLCGSQREESSCHQQTYKVVMKRSSPWALWTRCVKFSLSKFLKKNGFLSVFSPTLSPFNIVVSFDCKGGRKVAGATWLRRLGGNGGCLTEPEPDGARLHFANTGRQRQRAGDKAVRAREAGWQRCCRAWPASKGCLWPYPLARSRSWQWQRSGTVPETEPGDQWNNHSCSWEIFVHARRNLCLCFSWISVLCFS